ncbi:MAG: penicillin-binding protein 2 [Elusimicrobiota bacterium]
MWQADYLAREQKNFNWNLQILLGIIIAFFSVLGFRLFFLQIIRRQALLAISEQNRTQLYVEQANRGFIYDRKGEILADIQPSFLVTFSNLKIDEDKLAAEIKELSRLLRVPSRELREKINALKGYPFEALPLVKNISRDTLLKLIEEIPNLPGINIQVVPQRRYPKGETACHILGYIGEISKEELKKNVSLGDEYRPGDWIGKTGLEKIYDNLLRGEDGGSQVEVDAHGRQQRIIQRIEPVPGDNLILTLDYSLQKLAEESLRGKSGAVVALDPRNGEVLALASAPAFNPNIFIQKGNRVELERIFNDLDHPMMNRAIQGTYPPGSIFKPITALAGLEKGIDPTRKIFCPGFFLLGQEDRKFRCWNEKGHRRVGLIEAMAFSCDVYFYHLGLIVGSDLLEDWAKSFGLGSITGIDLPAEKPGLVAGKAWKKKNHRVGWYHGDTVNMAIGQGFFLLTPLQAAMIAGCVANGGKVYRPYLLKKVLGQNDRVVKEFYPRLIRNIEVEMKNLRLVQQGMAVVVASGTGQNGAVAGINVAGKTGTAQNPHGEDHAWFIAYAPVEYPQIAVSVIVENGGHGGAVAAPIAAKIIEEYLRAQNAKRKT